MVMERVAALDVCPRFRLRPRKGSGVLRRQKKRVFAEGKKKGLWRSTDEGDHVV